MKRLCLVTVVLLLFVPSIAHAGFGDTWAFGPWRSGERLVDPDADRLPMWDDSAGVMAWIDSSTPLDPLYATTIELGHATDTTLARASAGDVNIEGNIIYRAGGTDVPVTDGGSGAGTFTDGGVLLGSGTGPFTAMAVLGDGAIIVGDGTTDPVAMTLFTSSTANGQTIGLTNDGNIEFNEASENWQWIFTANQVQWGSDSGVDTVDANSMNLSSVGDLTASTVLESADVIYPLKCVTKTISANDDASADDFQFDDDAANSTAQNVDMGAILPAFAEIVSVQVRCFETVSAGTFQVTLGTASAGAELLAQATLDAANEIDGTATGVSPKLEAANAAKNVWIQGDPSGDWTAVGDGRWAVFVTYIDYGAVHTQNNP